MLKKVLFVTGTLTFAFGILLFSLFRTASVKYDFNPINPKDAHILGESTSLVDYYLPYPGGVLPDSPLWPLKAARDRLWLSANTMPTREAELYLLFADKRLVSAVILFEKGQSELGLSTLTKAEKYLESAYNLEVENRKSGYNTDDFLEKLANASLKHYELIDYILTIAPDEAKPEIIEVKNYPEKIYEDTRNILLDKRISPPENPFDWQ